MATGRQGLNCTLSYPKDGVTRAFRVRCNGVNHGVKIGIDESVAQVRRALYPHPLSVAGFAIKVQLNQYAEHKALTDWLAAYVSFCINPDTPQFPEMSVSVPSRSFLRRGVPLTGFEYGDHVASMVFERVITFETTWEPGDVVQPVSKVIDADNVTGRNESQYFYPTGIQLAGDQAPPDGTFSPIINPDTVIQQQTQQLLDDGQPDFSNLSVGS